MNISRLARRWAAVSTLALVLFSPVMAQNALYAENAGKMYLVLAARGTRPVVEIDGKRDSITGKRLALKGVDEYLPVFISVRDMEAQTRGMTNGINNEFHFRGRFESPYALDDVFLVLDLQSEQAGRLFFLYEVGRLEPGEARPVSLTVPLTRTVGRGRFRLHLFAAGGQEVLHSNIPFPEREAALDRMVARRIASVEDQAQTLFIGPAPDYPPKLRKANISGQAVISVRVTTSGRPLEPAIKSATDPAFGEAALAAVRQWRFLPEVKAGRPRENLTDIPFNFAPPPGGK